MSVEAMNISLKESRMSNPWVTRDHWSAWLANLKRAALMVSLRGSEVAGLGIREVEVAVAKANVGEARGLNGANESP